MTRPGAKQPPTTVTVQQPTTQSCGVRRRGRIAKKKSEMQASLVPMVVKLTPTRFRGAKVPKLRRLKSTNTSPGDEGTKVESPRRRPRTSTTMTARRKITSTLAKPVPQTASVARSKRKQKCSFIDLTGGLGEGETPKDSLVTTSVEPQDRDSFPLTAVTDINQDSRPDDNLQGQSTMQECRIGDHCEPTEDAGSIETPLLDTACKPSDTATITTTGKRRRGRPKAATSKAPKRRKGKIKEPGLKGQTLQKQSCEHDSTASEMDRSKPLESVSGEKTAKEVTDASDSALFATQGTSSDLSSVLETFNEPKTSDTSTVSVSIDQATETEVTPDSETDYSAVEVEYCPLTPQQKEVRKLARQKQLQEMRAREMALAREERFLKRQGLLQEKKRTERRIQWKRESDLVNMFIYSPFHVEDSPSDPVLPS